MREISVSDPVAQLTQTCRKGRVELELTDDPPVPALVAATTGIGWFVDRHVPAGEPLVGISFRADDGSLTGVGPTDAVRP